MELDLMTLSRIQFAMQLSFHIIFPTINIGLSALIVYFEYKWITEKQEKYFQLAHFFTKFFALMFGAGVVTGITLSFMFGTNFAKFTVATANVLGPLLSFEVMTAFFLEATFLGVMIFGWNKVPPWAHFVATCLVFFGTLLSAFWILSANSWMQTPSGYSFADGKFYPESWLQIIFNPSFIYRYTHMTLACFVSGSAVVAGISACYIIKNKHLEFAKTAFGVATMFITIVIPLQILMGDLHGLNTFEHQKAKVSAMEGRFETMKGAPLILFGIPNTKEAKIDYALEIPKLTSLILTHDLNGEVMGLNDIPRENWPQVAVVFWGFRVMVGIGMLFLLMSLTALYLRYKGKLYDYKLFLRLWVLTSPLGVVATLAGWYVTECGRFPWVVWELMRVKDALSNVPEATVLWSLIQFAVIYSVVGAGLIYYGRKLIKKGPDERFIKDCEIRTSWLQREEE